MTTKQALAHLRSICYLRDDAAAIDAVENQLADLQCMVHVFRGCIETGIMPAMGSECHKKVQELLK